MLAELSGARCASVTALSLSLLALIASPARAAVRDYPGAAPCNTTLQACITGSDAGDTVRIGLGTVVIDPVEIRKSITLTALPSETPPRISYVTVFSTNADVAVQIQYLSIRGAVAARTVAGGGNLHLSVLDNAIDAPLNSAVELGEATDPGAFGRKSALIARNVIQQRSQISACDHALAVRAYRSPTEVQIIDNKIAMPEGDCNGINAYLEGAVDMLLNIDRNVVRGDNFAGGIHLRNRGASTGPAGRQIASVTNNIVQGQWGDAGFPGSIVVSAEDRNARTEVRVVNNTITECRDGLAIDERPGVGARVTGLVANNIVAHCERLGIGIGPSPAAVPNLSNLVFGNGYELFEPGPGTRYGDPRFADTSRADFRPAEGSDAVDRGSDTALAATVLYDVYGAGRRFGQLDIGAAEAPFLRPPEPVPLTHGAWRVLLAALIALAVWASRSRAIRGPT